MSTNPIWIAGYGGPVAGAAPVWIASYGSAVSGAAEAWIAGYGGTPTGGASPVWIAGYGGTPTGGASPIWIGGTIESGSGGGGGPTSVWSAADAAANSMTLTNGGLTVTGAGAAGAWHSIRGSISKTSGKLYVEFSTITAASGNSGFGTADSSFDATGALGNSGHSVGIYNGGNNVIGGFTTNYAATDTVSAGDVLSIAIDFAPGKLWIAQNNVWVNSSSPATGTLPIISFTPATVGALVFGLSFFSSTPQTWTLNSTSASQTYAPPIGFKAWDAP